MANFFFEKKLQKVKKFDENCNLNFAVDEFFSNKVVNVVIFLNPQKATNQLGGGTRNPGKTIRPRERRVTAGSDIPNGNHGHSRRIATAGPLGRIGRRPRNGWLHPRLRIHPRCLAACSCLQSGSVRKSP